MENSNSNKKTSGPVILDNIEENTTFYYSNFKLFDENSELLFANYLSFKKNLQSFLGDDWENYAQKTIYNTIGHSTIFIQSRDVFSTALEVWLELRKDINFNNEAIEQIVTQKPILDSLLKNDNLLQSQEQTMEIEKDLERGDFAQSDAKTESNFEEEKEDTEGGDDQKGGKYHNYVKDNHIEGIKGIEVFEEFHKKVRAKFDQNHINETYFKALIHAFYVSAIKVWKTTLNDYSAHTLFGEGFLAESKKYLLMKLQNVYKTKFKMLKPIFVATERVKDYLYKDTKKNIILQQDLNIQDKKNVDNFTSSLKMENTAHFNIPISLSGPKTNEEQNLKQSFKNLKINSHDNSSTILGKRSATKARSVVEIRKINRKFEKLLNQNMIEFAAHYVNSMTKAPTTDWQISRSFVTNMVEVNYNKLLELKDRLNYKADEARNDVRIRFIQPTRDFYHRLMEVWIIFKTKSLNSEVIFTEYLEKVKESLGNLWSERFMNPTHNFFMTLYYEWHHLKQIETDTEEKVLLFIKKVKESMLKVWEENIVKRAEELTNRGTLPNKF